MKSLWAISIAALCAWSVQLASPTEVVLPKGWIAAPPPAEGSDHAWCVNYVEDEWTPAISTKNGISTLRIGAARPNREYQSIKTPEGRFVGSNQGEFGGEVSWQPKGGSLHPVPGTRNLVAFLQTDTGVLGVMGLWHLESNSGSVVRFIPGPASAMRVEKVVDLGAAPYAASIAPDGTVLIAIAGALVRVQFPDRLTVLHRNRVWIGGYPNSIAQDAEGVVYVGMRSAVARLRPNGAGLTEDWLVKSNCRSLVRKGEYGCRCAGD